MRRRSRRDYPLVESVTWVRLDAYVLGYTKALGELREMLAESTTPAIAALREALGAKIKRVQRQLRALERGGRRAALARKRHVEGGA